MYVQLSKCIVSVSSTITAFGEFLHQFTLSSYQKAAATADENAEILLSGFSNSVSIFHINGTEHTFCFLLL